MSGGLGFSKSKSQSSSEQNTFIDPAQQGFLNQLWSGATGLQQQMQPGIGQLQGLSEGLVGQGQGFLGGIGGTQQALGGMQGAGFGQGQAGIDALTGMAQGTSPAMQALSQQAFGQNPNLQSSIDMLGQDINRQMQRGFGQAGTQAVGMGQLGGGRQGVMEGLIGEAGIDAFTRGATQMRSDDIGRQLSAAAQMGGLQGQAGGQLAGMGLQQGQGNQANMLQSVLGQGQLGLGGLEGMGNVMNMGMQGFQSQFMPMLNLAQILGGPTVLSQGSSQGTSSSMSMQAQGGLG